MDLAALRLEIRARRRSLPAEARSWATGSVNAALVALLGSRPVGAIATYLASDGELDPMSAREQLEPLGWTFHLPVIGTERSMTFRRWNDSTTLVPNRFGIPEPVERAHEIRAADLDVVLVPCVAVDPAGNRLGMGGGYYDRTFGAERRPLLIAVAFDAQLVEHLPAQDWDVAVDVVVTESRVIHTRRAGADCERW